jgi:hypothetical protein
LINQLVGKIFAAGPKLAEECGKHRHVRSGGSFAPQIGVDHPSARVDRDAVAEVVRRIEHYYAKNY